MAEETIPRPIRFKFETVAQEVCDLAKVDYWEQSEVLSSLREQMETSYRAYDQAGLYKDDAEGKALNDFGSAEDVARVHRDGIRGLWRRLLFSQRYAVHRWVALLVFCTFHKSARTAGSLHLNELTGGEVSLKIGIFTSDFYIGPSIVALVAAKRLLIKKIPTLMPLVEMLAFLFLVGLFGEIAAEWTGSIVELAKGWSIVDDVPRWKNILAALVDLVIYALEAVTFFFIVPMSAAEILEIPAGHRAVVEAKRKRNLADTGKWVLWLDNCFRVITGQKHGFVWKIVRTK